jgi:hypothetical protein
VSFFCFLFPRLHLLHGEVFFFFFFFFWACSLFFVAGGGKHGFRSFGSFGGVGWVGFGWGTCVTEVGFWIGGESGFSGIRITGMVCVCVSV